MKCEDIRDLMLDVAAGVGEAGPTMNEHLRGCPACAGKLDDMRKTMAVLDEWQVPEPSPYFDTRLQAGCVKKQLAHALPGCNGSALRPSPCPLH